MADLSAYIRGKSLANEGVEFLKDEVNCAAATATGIDVLIIGAGIGGLTAALECYRKGHTIRIFEQWPKGGFAGKRQTYLESGCDANAHRRYDQHWCKRTSIRRPLYLDAARV